MLPRAIILAGFFAIFAAAAPAGDTGASTPVSPKSSYRLGPDDQVTIRIVEADEIPDKPFRIDEKGNIDLPMAGPIHAAGLSVHELQALLVDKFRVFIREPQVTVFVSEMRSQPVSVLGAVLTPGVHQLQGHKTLIEVLSLAGGPRADAGYCVKITRRMEWGPIPLPGATTDPTGNYSIAEVSLKSLLEATNPPENIPVMPDDVLTIPAAETIYVIGDVRKSGGFVLGERPSVTALQALAMAEGLSQMASASDARILRTTPGSPNRTEIPVDLKKILAGRASDIAMQANDILFVPTSNMKRLSSRALDAMVNAGAGLAIYHP